MDLTFYPDPFATVLVGVLGPIVRIGLAAGVGPRNAYPR